MGIFSTIGYAYRAAKWLGIGTGVGYVVSKYVGGEFAQEVEGKVAQVRDHVQEAGLVEKTQEGVTYVTNKTIGGFNWGIESVQNGLKNILPESLVPPKWLLSTIGIVAGIAGVVGLMGAEAFNLEKLSSLPQMVTNFFTKPTLAGLSQGITMLSGVGLLGTAIFFATQDSGQKMVASLFNSAKSLVPGLGGASPSAEPAIVASTAPTAPAAEIAMARQPDVVSPQSVAMDIKMPPTISGGSTPQPGDVRNSLGNEYISVATARSGAGIMGGSV